MILWNWKHLPKAEFSPPRINLASVLQLPAWDGASQNQHGVFELISAPLHLQITPLPASSFSLGDCSERHLTPACGALIWPCLLLGSQVQRFLKNNRIKYLKSPTQLPCKLFVKGTSTTYLPGHLLDIQTGYCISDSGKEISWVTSSSKFQSKQMVPSCNIHPDHPPPQKTRACLWRRKRQTMNDTHGELTRRFLLSMVVVVVHC